MCENSERWVFRLDDDFEWTTPIEVPEDLDFKDKDGKTRLQLRRPRQLVVKKDYAWDGCTPKACLFDVVVGIPDGVVDSRTKQPKAYRASLVHDVLYQFLRDG